MDLFITNQLITVVGLQPSVQLPPGQLPPRTTATKEIRHPGQLPPGQLPPRTIAT